MRLHSRRSAYYTQTMGLTTLNQKHRLFAEAYNGNVVEAMQIAGYTGGEAYLKQRGQELLRDPLVLDAIKHRSRYIQTTRKTIASREERQEFWTNLMYNKDPHAKKGGFDKNGNPLPDDHTPEVPMSARLKASELLGKSEADFVDRLDIDANISLTDIVMSSYKKPSEDDDEMSLEDIEAEYRRVRDGGHDEDEEDGEDETEIDPPELEYHDEDDKPNYSFL